MLKQAAVNCVLTIRLYEIVFSDDELLFSFLTWLTTAWRKTSDAHWWSELFVYFLATSGELLGGYVGQPGTSIRYQLPNINVIAQPLRRAWKRYAIMLLFPSNSNALFAALVVLIADSWLRVNYTVFQKNEAPPPKKNQADTFFCSHISTQ